MCFHKYGKWSKPTVQNHYYYADIPNLPYGHMLTGKQTQSNKITYKQNRVCKKCGKMQSFEY